jgi:LacI family transcriptional regulator
MQGRHVAVTDSPLVHQLRKLPTVWCLGRPAGCWGDVVLSNDHQTGALAAEYLVARGHGQLAFINPKPDHLLFMRREDGFIGAARRMGATVQSFCESPPQGWQLPIKPPLEVEMVQSLVDRALDARPRPTALFAAADSVAALVYRALAVRGLSPGRDIGVLSANNDRSLIAGLHPALTTFDIHASKIGRFAVRQLAARLADPEAEPCIEMMIEPTLVEGNSVVAAPKSESA